MKDIPVALQLYSVRDDMAADFEGTLHKVKAMGYDGCEFAGLCGHSAAEVKKMCEEIGLTPISAHVSYPEMLLGEETFKTYSEIGCKYIVIPWIGEEYLAGGEKNHEFIENVKKFGELARAHGMKLCYHNHDFEFEKFDDEYKFDLLYSSVSKDVLMTQIDTCWARVGGVDPAAYVRKYGNRVEIVHFKDFVGSKSENMYGLIGVDGGESHGECTKFDFRPVGHGVQDFPAIIDACREVGAKWVVVEQDMPCLDKTPLECAQMSVEYLKSL